MPAKKRSRLTAKQRVRARFNNAHVSKDFWIWDRRDLNDPEIRLIGSGSTPTRAWADAARRLTSAK